MKLLPTTVLGLVLTTNAFACSCIQKTSDVQAIEARTHWADAVFVGVALGQHLQQLESCDRRGNCVHREKRIISVEPLEPIFGVSHDPVDLVVEVYGASCGIHLLVGEPYLIYATRDQEGRLTTGLCSAHLANGEVELEEIEYLMNNRDRFAERTVPDGRSAKEFLEAFLEEQVAGYEIDVRLISHLWHDLDNNGHEELVAYFETQYLSPPPGTGVWTRKHRPGITVFHRSGESLLDSLPTWIRWCNDTPEYQGALLAQAGELMLRACSGKELRLALIDGNLKGSGWKEHVR